MSVRLDRMGHLTADSEAELHAFAQSIGMPRRWFQGPPRHRLWHYDCISFALQGRALRAGAEWLADPRDTVRRHPVRTAIEQEERHGR